MIDKKRYQLTIREHVQNLFFIKESLDLVTRLQLTGWIKKNTAKTVSLLINYSGKNCQRMIKWCKKSTKNDIVSDVNIIKETAYYSNNTFKIL